MFTVTNHARDRFAERFPGSIKTGESVDICINRAISRATLERGFMNDTRRIVWMLEKYGDFNFDYYVNDEMVFVTKDGVIITIMNRNDIGMQQMFGSRAQGRFRKKAAA